MDKPDLDRLDLKTLAADWDWLIDPTDYELLDISPFGDLFLRDRTGALCVLDINLGSLQYAAESGLDPADLFPELFDGRIAAGYREAQIFLKPGTCYGYKVQLVTAGSMGIENVYIAALTEYVSFMGCFHFQIKDVADGESVRIKIVRRQPN